MAKKVSLKGKVKKVTTVFPTRIIGHHVSEVADVVNLNAEVLSELIARVEKLEKNGE